jgi:hypothetical protein
MLTELKYSHTYRVFINHQKGELKASRPLVGFSDYENVILLVTNVCFAE